MIWRTTQWCTCISTCGNNSSSNTNSSRTDTNAQCRQKSLCLLRYGIKYSARSTNLRTTDTRLHFVVSRRNSGGLGCEPTYLLLCKRAKCVIAIVTWIQHRARRLNTCQPTNRSRRSLLISSADRAHCHSARYRNRFWQWSMGLLGKLK